MAAEQFAAQCDIVITNNFDTCGTLTKASLGTLTPAQKLALFSDGTQWYENGAYLKTQFEMKACGIRRYGFYDWLMTSQRPGMSKLINTLKRDRGPSLVEPFVMARQQSVVNSDYWYIESGWAIGDYTAEVTGPLLATQLDDTAFAESATRVVRIKSVYGGSGFQLAAAWFLPLHSIYILNTKAGAAAHGEWAVAASAVATDLSYIDVALVSRNGADETLADMTPENGIVLIGRNNVNDYESYCHNPANINPWKQVPFWYQAMRRTRCVDSNYLEIFNKLMADNRWFQEFADLPMAERNRQDELEWQKQFVHSFLFGRPLENQDLTNWPNLEQILSPAGAVLDPGLSGRLQAYRANMIGVYEILKDCVDADGFSRVRDIQNQPINIAEWFEANYEIYRARESHGRAGAQNIDWYTCGEVQELVETGIIEWYKNKYGDILRFNVDVTQNGGQNTWGFQWKSFKLPRYGIVVNLITNEAFDDLAAAFSAQDAGDGVLAARGRFLLALDIGKGGSIYPAILGSNRKVYTVGDINKLAQLDTTYSCVIEADTATKTLTSEIATAIVECPKNSLWMEGIALAAPIATGKTTPYGDLY